MKRKPMKPAALVLFLAVLAVAWWLENRKSEPPPRG